MTVSIHGKTYITVAERLDMVYKSGKSFEVIESAPVQVGDHWVWRAVIKVDDKQYVGNAEVHLNARPGSADATDAWACGETSAIGRAIAWAGFGAIESIASADEIVRGQAQVKESKPAIDAPLPSELRARAKELGKDFDAVVKFLFKKSIPDNELTPNDCQFIHVTFEKSAAIRKTAASGGGK